jgi:hypothetical protein
MKASHKEYDLIVGCQTVHLMPGDFIFGLKASSKDLNLSIQSIRTLLNFLKTSQNLTLKTTNKFSIISIVNWDSYQDEDTISNNQINKPLTNEQQTTNNKQELKEHKNKKNIFIKPTLEEITTYCRIRKNTINPETFIAHYESNGWMVGKNKMKNWKAAIITWEKGDPGNGQGKGLYPNRGNFKAGHSEGGFGIPKEWEGEPRVLPSPEEVERGKKILRGITEKIACSKNPNETQ